MIELKEQAGKETQIPNCINALHIVTNNLVELVKDLDTRLGSVLVLEEPPTNAENPIRELVPLAGAIRDNVDTLEQSVVERLHSILERLEL